MQQILPGSVWLGFNLSRNYQIQIVSQMCHLHHQSFNHQSNHCLQQVLFRETSPQQTGTYSYTVTGLRPWTQYEFSIRTHNPAGHTHSPWVTVTTRQAPPRGLAPPTVSHIQGRPSEVLVSWTPPLEPNGVLQSYRIQRNNVSFSFSFDPTVLSYTDEDLLPFSTYRYCLALHILFYYLK